MVEIGNFPISTHEINPKLPAKRSPKLELVKEWLKNNPNSKKSNREIARLLGVSNTWVNLAKRSEE